MQICIFLSVKLCISQANTQDKENSYIHFNFDNNLNSGNYKFEGDNYAFVKGINGKSLTFSPNEDFDHLVLNNLILDGTKDFSVQFWVRTFSKKPTVLISQKEFSDKSINSQKNKGWVLYSSGGTFAFSIGSGDKRLNYERENGDKMPISDGEWHQITMTYNKETSEVRLYYDGHNKAIYNVGFDFYHNKPLVIGTKKNGFDYNNKLLPQIKDGAVKLQALVDEFNSLGVGTLKNDEFLDLVVNPDQIFTSKNTNVKTKKPDSNQSNLLKRVNEIRKELLKNPYTVFQIMELTELKPISKIYYLDNGKVCIHKETAQMFSQQTQLFPSEFELDELYIWDKDLNASEVLDTYRKYKNSTAFKFEPKLDSLNIGNWNIWHGGKHFTIENDNWDSRMRIVEMIKEKNLDVVLLQETYSSGDFIAAELGYYFVTASDWDYCFQGSNISIISRYPIKEVYVPLEASFMNLGAKLILSESQEIYAMSNWYGMTSFPKVYDFHKDRFSATNVVPAVFGGDFNAVPHTDGGDSPASLKLLNNGFTDAYRSLYPNVKEYPGFSHIEDGRIDQIYYKGKGIKNFSTELISEWPNGFPSDHFLIISKFKLNY